MFFICCAGQWRTKSAVVAPMEEPLSPKVVCDHTDENENLWFEAGAYRCPSPQNAFQWPTLEPTKDVELAVDSTHLHLSPQPTPSKASVASMVALKADCGSDAEPLSPHRTRIATL